MTAVYLALAITFVVNPQTSKSDSFGITGPQFWRTPFGGSFDWKSLAGDADGDGKADLLAVGAAGDSIVAVAKTSPQGKPLMDNPAHASVGGGVIVSAGGTFFSGSPACQVVTIFSNGSVRMTWGMNPGANTYPSSDICAQIASTFTPQPGSRSSVADLDGDGKLDILVLDPSGRLLLLRNQSENGQPPKFTPVPVNSAIRGVRRFCAGTLGSDKNGQCVWLDESGTVKSAFITLTQNGMADIGAEHVIDHASPNDHLAVGRFRGTKGADVLIGQKLLSGPSLKTSVILKDLPQLEIAKDDGPWDVADIDGNGKDDLIRHPEGGNGQDVLIHFSYDSTDPAKGFYCSANDGLLDAWKIGKIKPGGLDLAALGCKVGHRDIVIEIERLDNEPIERLKANMDRVIHYFASLPIPNPDGTTGIAVHMIYRTPWQLAKKDEIMGHFDELFPPIEHRGIVHSAFTMSGGPLVSQICGDHGKTNEGWAEFLHEFGHQIDLRHDAFHPSQNPNFNFDVGCALYPSLMSYSYSYSVDDQNAKIGYSDGSFTSFVVNERHLSEKLPFPIDKVHFLAGGPYRFKIQASADGKSTLVDWNWNGIFDEKEVIADTNYGHGVDFGPSYVVGKTGVAPAAVIHGDSPNGTPLLIYGKDSRLTVRSWIGNNRDSEGGQWSPEVSNLNAGISGDPTAAYLDGITWVSYPTEKGIILRPITISGSNHPVLGSAILVPGTVGLQPTITSFNGQLALLFWRNKTTNVSLRLIKAKGTELTMGGERPLDLLSDVPVGAVAGPTGSLWIGRIQSDGKENGGRTEVIRYVVAADGSATAAYRSWLGGNYARHRMILLWRPEPGNLPEGRVYQLSGGTEPAGPTQDQWITMNVPYPDESGGWLYRRYQQNGFTSPSVPGACFCRDDILYAFRCHGTDDLRVAFYGSGATPTILGDYNDLAHICDYGLSRSIRGLLK